MAFQLAQHDGKFLVELARKAVETYLNTGRMLTIPKETPTNLLRCAGVFVTINKIKNGEKQLRGCIGYPYPNTKLAKAIIECAISSATRDPRFSPLSFDELEHVVFEISVLTPPELVETGEPKEILSRIKIGKDGLIVERELNKGLLLPQVPIEQNWEAEEFLCQCCLKAGLPPDAWLIKGTKIHRFQAIVFAEDTPKGETKLRKLRWR